MAYYMISARDAAEPLRCGSAVRYLQSLDGRAYSEMNAAAWTRAILGELIADGTQAIEQILFHVHGFNVDQESARARHLKILEGLTNAGWRGVMISYDWPSEGETLAYLQDRGHARRSSELLITGGIRLLREARLPDCYVSVNVICHSMGAFVLEHAFKHVYQDMPADWSVDQVLLVAGDVGAGDYAAAGKSAERYDLHAGRVTAYINRYDQALMVSDAKRLATSPRLGRKGLPESAPDLFCEVDCTPLFEATCPAPQHITPAGTHCFYFDRPEFYQDVTLTLAGGVDRSVIPTRQKTANNRFALQTGVLPAEAYQRAYALASMSGQRRFRKA